MLQSMFNQPLRENEKVYLRWDNLNYFVPVMISMRDKMLQKIGQTDTDMSGSIFDKIDHHGIEKENVSREY